MHNRRALRNVLSKIKPAYDSCVTKSVDSKRQIMGASREEFSKQMMNEQVSKHMKRINKATKRVAKLVDRLPETIDREANDFEGFGAEDRKTYLSNLRGSIYGSRSPVSRTTKAERKVPDLRKSEWR